MDDILNGKVTRDQFIFRGRIYEFTSKRYGPNLDQIYSSTSPNLAVNIIASTIALPSSDGTRIAAYMPIDYSGRIQIYGLTTTTTTTTTTASTKTQVRPDLNVFHFRCGISISSDGTRIAVRYKKTSSNPDANVTYGAIVEPYELT